MKTPEELNALKNEVETLNKKLAELSEEELAQVSGGGTDIIKASLEQRMKAFDAAELSKASVSKVGQQEIPVSGSISCR